MPNQSSKAMVDVLLAEDHQTPPVTRRVLATFDPWAAAALEEVADLYWQLFETKQASDVDRCADIELRKVADSMGITFEKFEELIRSNDRDPRIIASRDGYWRFRAADVGNLMVILCARHFRWLATDLLRGRVTSAIGYVRLQAEAVALMHLFNERPKETDAWIVAGTTGDGKVFYNKTKKAIFAHLERLFLAEPHNWGSAHALHCRILTFKRAHGIKRDRDERPQRPYLWLKDHEFSEDAPLPFVEATIRILAAQGHLLNGIVKARPAIDYTDLRKMIGAFGIKLKALCDKFDSASARNVQPVGPPGGLESR